MRVRRGLVGGVIALVALGAGAFVWARFLAGGPVGPIPGGALRGELATEPVSDWSFAASHDYLSLEHRGGTLPWSTRVWFMVHEGRIHLILPSLFGRGLHDRLLADPHVRIRLDGRLYDQVAVRVDEDDAAVFAAVVPPLVRRQFSIEVDGALRPIPGRGPVETWLWRLEDP